MNRTDRTCRTTRFADLPTPKKIVIVVLASIQLALAVTAWADLARRPADKVDGSKLKWASIIAINFVGPIAYFRKGRRD
ncbi:MAG: hypothetical protein GXY65_06120 [Rhodococcus sp.]|uniref:PLDc N-terminal domain-containing protein n=1 Tax=Rhodococcus TaxID=1827 RepID=UPI0016A82C86|nr:MULTISPECIES: PLDc N-terminal domain-containing protein [Rhodococcus]NLV78910.1 hypothetical protein [Rhodococcus sp. (in: high G+C Gram-positive bacteria)]